jgi:peroxiredoxin
MNAKQASRFQELEDRFSELEKKLKESPEKEAMSILHAMLQENRRQPYAPAPTDGNAGRSFEAVANLYKSAPKMEGNAENEGLAEGSLAPDFTLMDDNGLPVSLSNFRSKNVVLVFYPLDWSPACSDQLSLYQGDLEHFDHFNAQLIAISVDSIYSHGAWAAVRGITFPLLSDFHPKGEVARSYGVLRKSDGFTERAIFVIDKQGIIRYKHISVQLDHIPDIYDLFEQLKKLEEQPDKAPASNK